MSWTAFSVLWILLRAKSVWSVWMTDFQIPDHARVGDTINLTCQYDLQGDKLWSVKWLRDGLEFYRFMPLHNPQKTFFKRPGIDVDLEHSDDMMVTLKEVNETTSGEIKCEVSLGPPNHVTVLAVKDLSIDGSSYRGTFSHSTSCKQQARRHNPRVKVSGDPGMYSKDVWCVRIKELKFPDHARVGDTISLTCQYDFLGYLIWSVKWYRNGYEFYRFMPLHTLEKTSFKRPGIDVDLEHSEGIMVTLKGVSETTSGEFKCEVSTGPPYFLTVYETRNLSIYEFASSSTTHTIYGLLTFAVVLGIVVLGYMVISYVRTRKLTLLI